MLRFQNETSIENQATACSSWYPCAVLLYPALSACLFRGHKNPGKGVKPFHKQQILDS